MRPGMQPGMQGQRMPGQMPMQPGGPGQMQPNMPNQGTGPGQRQTMQSLQQLIQALKSPQSPLQQQQQQQRYRSINLQQHPNNFGGGMPNQQFQTGMNQGVPGQPVYRQQNMQQMGPGGMRGP